MKAVSIALLLSWATASQAQQTQSPVQEVAPGIVSTGKGFTVTFAPDGREVYFTARDPDAPANKPVMHVYRSRLEGGAWQPASAVSFSTTGLSDLDPFLSVDGKRLFFVSTRPAPGKDPARPDMDIWFSESVDGSWGPPQWIPELNSVGKEGSPSLDRANTIYFFSDRNGPANQNAIYLATWTGEKFTEPRKMDPPVNAGPSDTSPWIAPDGRTLLFYSTRPGGAGQADLYVSTLKSGRWSVADNLGSVVNTPEFEYNPSVSRDGKTLYFGRNGRILLVPIDSVRSAGLSAANFRE